MEGISCFALLFSWGHLLKTVPINASYFENPCQHFSVIRIPKGCIEYQLQQSLDEDMASNTKKLEHRLKNASCNVQ